MDECKIWLDEVKQVFSKLNRKKITVNYKKMRSKQLGYVRAKIREKFNFDPEALLLGKNNKIKKRRLKPKEYEIYISERLQKIKNLALRKEIIQHTLIHELLHIENDDLITLSKRFSRRKKKKIHINEFDEEVFKRFNKLREIKGLMQIQKKEHLNIAINKILESINW
jgi:hypothetical protein